MANSPVNTQIPYRLPDLPDNEPDISPEKAKDGNTKRLSGEARSRPASQSAQGTSILGPWLTENGISENAQFLIDTLMDVRTHGLDPEEYALSRILLITDELQKQRTQRISDISGVYGSNDAKVKDDLRFKLGYLLDKSFVKLAEHLGQGVVDGKSLQKRLKREIPQVNSFNILVSISNADITVEQALDSVVQTHPDYKRLRNKMRDLLTEQSTNVSRTLVNDKGDVVTVTEATDKQLIRSRLFETGDLTFEFASANDPDERLVSALKTFQENNGLKPDGIVGRKTRTALNASIEEDIEAVALSLERWRWLSRDLGDKYLIANIPGYNVKFVENGTTQLSMRTVVGKERHQTPSFTQDMTHMVFNPTWTVPNSIANNELLPIERRSPGYLASRNFDVIKKKDNRWIRVPVSTLTKAELNASRFPYALRQRGGDGNALGRMKFMMPNQYSIYLHDTPAQKYFAHTDRAYSHGCVRLSDPDAMAQYLLLSDGYTQSEIDAFMSTKNNRRVNFRTAFPTHIVYLTSWVGEDDVLQKRPDVYRNDEALLDALKQAGTVLSEGFQLAKYTN